MAENLLDADALFRIELQHFADQVQTFVVGIWEQFSSVALFQFVEHFENFLPCAEFQTFYFLLVGRTSPHDYLLKLVHSGVSSEQGLSSMHFS